MSKFLDLPPTKFGTALDIPDTFKIVYKKSCDNLLNNTYSFFDIYSSDIEYDENCVIVPLTSVYNGYETFEKGTVFVNILKSTGDVPRDTDEKRKTWKYFAQLAGIEWKCHASRDEFYDSSKTDVLAKGQDFTCNDCDKNGEIVDVNVVGGHVMMNRKTPCRMPNNSEVYILPICKHHNSKNVPHKNSKNINTTPGNGNGFYMKLSERVNVIKMKGYLPDKY